MAALLAPCPDPGRAAARRALSLLALLALLAAADPAQAFAVAPPKFTLQGTSVSAGPLDVVWDVDPASGQASASACVERDPVWRLDAGQDSDGDLVVWVPAGNQAADGSHKAKPTCGQGPADGPCVRSDGDPFAKSEGGACGSVLGERQQYVDSLAQQKPIDLPVNIGPGSSPPRNEVDEPSGSA